MNRWTFAKLTSRVLQRTPSFHNNFAEHNCRPGIPIQRVPSALIAARRGDAPTPLPAGRRDTSAAAVLILADADWFTKYPARITQSLIEVGALTGQLEPPGLPHLYHALRMAYGYWPVTRLMPEGKA